MIEYRENQPLEPVEIARVFEASGISRPTKDIPRIAQMFANPGDLVMDCYAGSGTTLTVASSLDRRWIGVDRSDEAIKTILHRLANGTERMGDFVNEQSKPASLS